MDACARSDSFVSAKEFLLRDAAAERKFGFSLAAAYDAAQQSLLLENVHVFLTPGEMTSCFETRSCILMEGSESMLSK